METSRSWERRMVHAQRHIGTAALEKVVMARGIQFQAPARWRFDAAATLHTLRRQHPGGYCFGIGRGNTTFVGASPETLISAIDGQVTTHALAGTAPRGRTAEEDDQLGMALLASAKDRSEQQVVVNMLERTLSEVCTHVTSAKEPTLLRLPHVQHLSTPIAGALRNGHHVLELVGQLHPTPAVCGAPTAQAEAGLAQNESLDRGWYSGPVGWVSSDGSGVFSVAIRSALLLGSKAYAYAGAGIVEGSNAEAEWQETALKLQTVSSALRCREVCS
jgi:isochorismate synthase